MTKRIKFDKTDSEQEKPRETTENRVKHLCNNIGDKCAETRQMVKARDELDGPMRETLLQFITNIQEQASKDRLTLLRGSYAGFTSEPDGHFIPKPGSRARAAKSLAECITYIKQMHCLVEEKNSSKEDYIWKIKDYLDFLAEFRNFRVGDTLLPYGYTSSEIPTQQESLFDHVRPGRDALAQPYEHERAVKQSRQILEYMKELRTCKPSRRPEVLAGLLLVAHVFPEEMSGDMRASEKLARIRKTQSRGRIPDVSQYIVKDLERGGPVARLVNREQAFRDAKGLIAPISPDKLSEIYEKEYRNMHGADTSINSLRGFLQAVEILDRKLREGTIRGNELSPMAVPIITGIGRAPYTRDLPVILGKSGFPENGGTLVVPGDPGWYALGVHKVTTEMGIPFSEVHTFDICTEEQAFDPGALVDYISARDHFIPPDKERQEIGQKINQHFECDLTQVKLTEWLNAHKLDEPIFYSLDNVLGYYNREKMISILKRLRDIPDALGREPASFLHVSYGFADNPSAMGALLIDLTTGHVLRADDPAYNLQGSNVRGSKDQPFQIEEDELVRSIEAKRKAVLHKRERFPVMSDEFFEQICQVHKFETGKWTFSQ